MWMARKFVLEAIRHGLEVFGTVIAAASENVAVQSSVLWTAIGSRDLFRLLDVPNGDCSRLRRSSDGTKMKSVVHHGLKSVEKSRGPKELKKARGQRNNEGNRSQMIHLHWQRIHEWHHKSESSSSGYITHTNRGCKEWVQSVFYVEGCRAESSKRFQRHGLNIIEESSGSSKIRTNDTPGIGIKVADERGCARPQREAPKAVAVPLLKCPIRVWFRGSQPEDGFIGGRDHIDRASEEAQWEWLCRPSKLQSCQGSCAMPFNTGEESGRAESKELV
ncbi:hypothetical protein DFH08DRAFT_811195 [Mycena albidolilacea]|uniref:Uncharacterized protein n=1 Tax=Mycena albidolilacea TaxID=1033008 RepID=A0AAD6ZWE4_9AGAR|nr:hypothetical protein DFH08DRAFT_811195 [Mycena albidolilacea]